jgi:acylphosphatase
VDHYLISGRVQGVGYRAWCNSYAKKLKLAGWVRNIADNRVEVVVFNGAAGGVKALGEALAKGPLFASVESVQHAVIERDLLSEDLQTPAPDFAILATSNTPLFQSLK